MSLAIRGASGSGVNGTLVQSVTIPVATGDMVVVYAGLSPQSVYARVPAATYDSCLLSSLTATGMTFTQRWAYTANPGSGDGSLMWEYYGFATFTGDLTITGTMTIDVPAGSIKPAWALIAFSVPAATGFDTNPSVPVGDF